MRLLVKRLAYHPFNSGLSLGNSNSSPSFQSSNFGNQSSLPLIPSPKLNVGCICALLILKEKLRNSKKEKKIKTCIVCLIAKLSNNWENVIIFYEKLKCEISNLVKYFIISDFYKIIFERLVEKSDNISLNHSSFSPTF